MTEIGFYHLTRQPAERALAKLLGRTLAGGKRALVLSPTPERVKTLDEQLWQQTDVEWLPHGTAKTGYADLQPVFLTDEDAPSAPNDASFLFLDNRASQHLARFTRVFDLFDGRDPASVATARDRYRQAKAEGHALTYWRETERGWERQ